MRALRVRELAVEARRAFGAGHRELPQGWVHHIPTETSVVGGSCTELAVVGQPSVRTKLLVGVRYNRLVSEKLRGSLGGRRYEDVQVRCPCHHPGAEIVNMALHPRAAGALVCKQDCAVVSDLEPKLTSGMLGQAERLR